MDQDDPAGHPSPIDFGVKTRCLPINVSISNDLHPIVRENIINNLSILNKYSNCCRQRFYVVMNAFIVKCIEERNLSLPFDNPNLDRIWGLPEYRANVAGEILSERGKSYNEGSLINVCNVLTMINRISSPFGNVRQNVCKYPILEEVMQDMILGDQESITYAREIDFLAPQFGRNGLIQHIAEEYVVNCKRMMYGDVKRFQSKWLVQIST